MCFSTNCDNQFLLLVRKPSLMTSPPQNYDCFIMSCTKPNPNCAASRLSSISSYSANTLLCDINLPWSAEINPHQHFSMPCIFKEVSAPILTQFWPHAAYNICFHCCMLRTVTSACPELGKRFVSFVPFKRCFAIGKSCHVLSSGIFLLSSFLGSKFLCLHSIIPLYSRSSVLCSCLWL